MIYSFELKESDVPSKHWIIVKDEDKSNGFRMSKSELNQLQIDIKNYLDSLEREE